MRCVKAAAARARPLEPLRSLAASAPRTVMDRSCVGDPGGRLSIADRASVIRYSRDCGSLQWVAPSRSDHRAPADTASPASPPSNRAPIPNRICPRSFSPSAWAAFHGNGSNRGSQASSSVDNSPPVTPLGRSSASTACKRGSAGASSAESSDSRRSRHQASRTKPRLGSLLVATTSAKARSRLQSARNAGRTRAGSV